MKPWTVSPNPSTSQPSVSVDNTDSNVLIIGGIHGDELCGPYAIKYFFEQYRTHLTKPVSFLIANPLASQQRTRYIDTDLDAILNQTYREKEPEQHEEFISQYLKPIINSYEYVFSLHSSTMGRNPFGVFSFPIYKSLLQVLSDSMLTNAIQVPRAKYSDSLIEYNSVLQIDCGEKQTNTAVRNGVKLILSILDSLNSIDYTAPTNPSHMYQYNSDIISPKPVKSIHQSNFTPVESGRPLYTTIDNQQYQTKKPITPVFFSKGDNKTIGYELDYCGELQDASIYYKPNSKQIVEQLVWK